MREGSLSVWVATGGGVGRAPVMPGTFGSVAGTLIFCGLHTLFPPSFVAFLLLSLFGFGIYVSFRAERVLRQTDAPSIVIDEIVAAMLTGFLLPFSWGWQIVGFLFFRFFDIVKPPPIRRMEKIKGGLGIMADDLVAALYAVGLLRLLERNL